MVGCFHLDYGLAWNMVTGTFMTQTGTPGLSAADGPARTFLNNDTQYWVMPGDNIATSPFNLAGEWSLLVTFYDLNQAVIQQPIARVNFGNSGWNLQFDTTNDGTFWDIDIEWVDTDTVFQNSIWRCRRPNRINHIAFSFSAVGNDIKVYANGTTGYAEFSTPATIKAIKSNSASSLTIGTDSDIGATRGCVNPLSRVVVWNRVLTPQELTQVTIPKTAYAYMQPRRVWTVQGSQLAAQAFPCGGGVM